MAKKWIDVENSEGFQSLSSPDKFRAKKAYWDEVVTTNTDFNLLSDEDKVEAKKVFHGGILAEDIPDFDSKDVRLQVLGDTISGTADVIGESAGKLATGLVQPLLHPVETVKGLSGLLAGAFQKIVPGQQAQEHHFDTLAKMYKDRYGSVDAIADTVAEDPFGFVGDVYMAAGLTSVGLKSIGKTKAGSFPMHGRSITATGDALKKLKPLKSVEDKIVKSYRKVFDAKQKSAARVIDSNDNIVGRVKALQENIPEEGLINNHTGKTFNLPSNEYEALLVSQNAKELIWRKATNLSQGATKAGAKIDLGDIAKKAGEKTKSQYGSAAVKTSLRDVVKKMDNEIKVFKKDGGVIDPTKAQELMKTMSKEASKRKQGGISVDFDLDDFNVNFYEELVKQTDNVIGESLKKAGYKHYRKQYAQVVSGEKALISSANKFLTKQAKGAGGITHPIANLFSLEALGSGIATGQTGQGLMKFAIIRGAVATLDWYTSPSRHVKGMFKNASKLKSIEPVHVFNPEILRNMPVVESVGIGFAGAKSPKLIPKLNMKELGFTPTKPQRLKRITTSRSGDVILADTPIKKLTFNPTLEKGTRLGPEISGGSQGLKGGFGQFIVRGE